MIVHARAAQNLKGIGSGRCPGTGRTGPRCPVRQDSTPRAGVNSKSLATTGRIPLLVLFDLSLFLWSKPGFLLVFSLAFVSSSLITHIGFSLLENDLYRDSS